MAVLFSLPIVFTSRMALYLGVDFGTSTAKATVLDDRFHTICAVRERLKVLNPKPGFYEVDPERTWWATFKRILGKISRACRLDEIVALSISSVCGSFVPVNENFEPTYNAILYGLDTRSAGYVELLNNLFGNEYLISRLGSIFTTHSVIPKLLWLKERVPNVYRTTRYFLESANYITAKLTGEVAWDYPTANGCQLLDIEKLDYPNDMLNRLALDIEKLPNLKWPLDVLGYVSERGAEATGLKPGTKVMVGSCDVYAEAISCGVEEPGELVVVAGSTVSVLLHTRSLVFVEGFSSGVSYKQGLFRVGGATSSGGKFIEHFQKLIKVPKNVKKSIKKMSLPTGLIILPYLDGARCPYHNPRAVSVIYGLKSNTRIEDLYIALRECLALEIGVIVEKLKVYIPNEKPVHITGGLSNDQLFCRLLADVLGRKVIVHRDVDASFGDALIARGMLLKNTLDNSRLCQSIILPNQDVVHKYRVLIQHYDQLYKALLPIMTSPAT